MLLSPLMPIVFPLRSAPLVIVESIATMSGSVSV